MSDLDDMLSGQSPEAEETVQPEQAQPEQEQADTTGQPEAEEPKAEQPEPEETGKEPTVPLAVFKSMRDDLKHQLDSIRNQMDRREQPREAPKVPDMFEDPQGYQQYMQQQVQGATTQMKLEFSRFHAEREFGKEAIDEVMEYFNQHPQLSHQFMTEASPFHAAKAYVDAQKTAQEIGSDPAAYRAKLEKDIRAQIEAEMAAKQVQEMAGKKAPSLAGVNGSGGKTDPGWQGPTDLNALIGE